ncbi:hypothetical protein E4U55_007126 [Claviceps digitariae]|nr:hypothetical protein E4U55_007126 [Claviceps digitariae]
MQLLNSAALAVMAIFAGQTLAQVAIDPAHCTIGSMDPNRVDFAPCLQGPGTWTCEFGSVVTYNNGVYSVQAAKYAADVAFTCQGGPPQLMYCAPQISGEITPGCPPDKITVTNWTLKPPPQ